jgi:hypothetical protein
MKTGNPYWKVRLSTADLLDMIACFIKKEKVLTAADLNYSVQGVQPYWSFPFSKDSLVKTSVAS